MVINPKELLEKKFGRSFRGYDPVEVDTYLREVAGVLDDLMEQNAAQAAKLEQLENELERYRQLQETINAALLTAQKAGEETRAAAQREAEAMVREAQAKAKEILIAVRQGIRRSEEELAAARRDKERFLADFEALLQSHLNWVRSQPREPIVDEGEEVPQEESPQSQGEG